MADKMFNQDNTLADTLIRKVRVAGIENPQNVGGTASRIEIAFGENMPTETLEASTAYYAKIGGKAVVEITTSEEVPVDCTGLAKLFAGTSFEEDGVKFTAAVDDNTVTSPVPPARLFLAMRRASACTRMQTASRIWA